MKALKKKSLKSVLWGIIIFWGVAAALTAACFSSLLTALSDPVPLESVDYDKDFDGLFVRGTLYGIYDWYLEESGEDGVFAKEYIIDANEKYYICLRAAHEDMITADQLVDAYYLYWEGEDDGTLLMQAQYEIEGVIKPIPADSLEILYEYLEWETLDESVQATFLPYYIEVNSYGRYDADDLFMLLGVAGICFLIGCVLIALLLSGHYQKSVKKYIANSSNPELAREQVENFIQSTPEINGLRYNNDFICGHNIGKTAFGETSKLAWVYLHTISHSYYFITIGKTYQLHFCFADGTRQVAEIKKESFANEHIENISKLCPQAIVGYTDELRKLYNKNLPEFLNLKYNKVQEENNIF